jgi:hypothetical protein
LSIIFKEFCDPPVESEAWVAARGKASEWVPLSFWSDLV